MKRFVSVLMVGMTVTVLMACHTRAHAQDLERVTESDPLAKQVLDYLMEGLKKVNDAPVKVEADTDKAVLLYNAGLDMGAAFLPHKGLSEESIQKSDKEVAPLGVLFLYHLAPAVDKKPVDKEKIRTISISVEGQDIHVPTYYMGVKTEAEGKRHLLVYGKDNKEPLLKVSLDDKATDGDRPVIIEAKNVGSGEGTLNVNVLKKFQAVVPLKGTS
ncbi:MAG: hypothetical protein NZT92_01500 [Abditibacteriales bacterium]|nr:hypothetical protein [Abditibacteriales bacterium]MDW8364840.1 hypothetical protein [Abditibacteriales bacterium]